jgi:hypothetical protein
MFKKSFSKLDLYDLKELEQYITTEINNRYYYKYKD